MCTKEGGTERTIHCALTIPLQVYFNETGGRVVPLIEKKRNNSPPIPLELFSQLQIKGSRYHDSTNHIRRTSQIQRNQTIPVRTYGAGRGETGEDGAEYLHGAKPWARRGSGAGGGIRNFAAAVGGDGLRAVDARRPVAVVREETGPESFPKERDGSPFAHLFSLRLGLADDWGIKWANDFLG
jgi:hypothetical protein